jgi:hypothetical protein
MNIRSNGKYIQGQFIPRNTKKYIGKYPIIYRSSWEREFMKFLDNSPSIINWSSESIIIPYKSPIDGKIKNYVPDFFVKYIDRKGKIKAEIIEIKPKSETLLSEARSKKDQIALYINAEKWKNAQIFCKKRGMNFRVLTEEELFYNPKNRKRRK